MGCSSCRGKGRASTKLQQGAVQGYEVTYPDGSKAPALVLTRTEVMKILRDKPGSSAVLKRRPK